MSVALSLALLVAAAEPAAPSISVAPLASRGVTASTVDALSLLLPTELRKRLPGQSVVSSADLANLLGAERQRELMGCSEAGTSCLMELSDAIGTGEMLTGSVGKIGNTWVLELQRLDLKKQRPRGSATRTVRAEEDLIDAMRAAVQELFPVAAPPARPVGALPVTLWIAGGVLLAGGAVGLAVEQDVQTRFNAQQPGQPSFGSPTVTRADAQLAQVLFPLSLVGFGLGAASVALGVWRFLAAEPVAVSLQLLPGGAFASVGARF